MSHRAVIVAALLALTLIACAQQVTPEQAARRARPALSTGAVTTHPDTDIYLTGFLLYDALNGKDVSISTKGLQPHGLPISLNVPFHFNHGVVFRVRDKDGPNQHDYDVLMSPVGGPNEIASVVFRKSSAARPYLTRGWIVLIGELPVGETSWGSSTASGSHMAIRLATDPDTNQPAQFVYNLEEHDPNSVVTVTLNDDPNSIELRKNQYAVCPQTANARKTDIQPGDVFVQRARAVVKSVGIMRPHDPVPAGP